MKSRAVVHPGICGFLSGVTAEAEEFTGNALTGVVKVAAGLALPKDICMALSKE